MHRSIVILCVLTCCAMSVTETHAAIIEIYDGVGAGELRSDWEAAVGGVFDEENFADGIWQGVTATPIGILHGSFGVSGGEFNDRLLSFNSTEFEFDTPITAFGGNWDLSPGGAGLGIVIDVEGEQVVQEIPNFFTGQFFGFISDVPFTQIILTSGSQGGFAETYSLDNVVSADTTAVPVPEPSTIFLLCMAAFGLAALRLPRRRRVVDSSNVATIA